MSSEVWRLFIPYQNNLEADPFPVSWIRFRFFLLGNTKLPSRNTKSQQIFFSASIFFIMVYFWIRSISNIYIKIAAFSSLVLNPYLIDYFSLARGYSSGLMFEALSLVCFYSYIYHHKQKFQLLSILFAGMSTLANFNFFYFFVAFCIIYFYVH